MLYIQKQKPSSETADEIQRVKQQAGWAQLDKNCTELVREAFDQINKVTIRSQLLKEQRGLCAYCMRRIGNDHYTTIEHFIPIEENGELALEYGNMMACCDGGRRADRPRSLCCDAAKKDRTIMISPYNRDQMERVHYDRNGRVFIEPRDEALQNDIDHILKLNGEVDTSGRIVGDTSTKIVYGRRETYRRYAELVERLDKRQKNIRAALTRKLSEIENAKEYEEYAGVWIYFLNRKLRHVS